MDTILVIGALLLGLYLYDKVKSQSYNNYKADVPTIEISRDIHGVVNMIENMLMELNASFSSIIDDDEITIKVPLYIKYGTGNTIFTIDKDLNLYISTRVTTKCTLDEYDNEVLESLIADNFSNEPYTFRCLNNNIYIFSTEYKKSFYAKAEIDEMNKIHGRFLTQILTYIRDEVDVSNTF